MKKDVHIVFWSIWTYVSRREALFFVIQMYYIFIFGNVLLIINGAGGDFSERCRFDRKLIFFGKFKSLPIINGIVIREKFIL